jgi:hypothetical protein
VIDKNAARAFQIKFDPGTVHLEGFVGGWIK